MKNMPATRNANKRTPRTPITIQLTDADADLLNWLSGLADGTRQGTIKAALRAYRDSGQPAKPDVALDSALTTLSTWFSELAIHMDNQFATTRETLANITIVAGSGESMQAPFEATPRLTAEELAQREANMKRAKKW